MTKEIFVANNIFLYETPLILKEMSKFPKEYYATLGKFKAEFGEYGQEVTAEIYYNNNFKMILQVQLEKSRGKSIIKENISAPEEIHNICDTPFYLSGAICLLEKYLIEKNIRRIYSRHLVFKYSEVLKDLKFIITEQFTAKKELSLEKIVFPSKYI